MRNEVRNRLDAVT